MCIAREDHPLHASGLSRDAFQSAEHVIVTARGMGHVHEQIEKQLLKICPTENVRVISHSFLIAAQLVENSDYIATVPSRLMDIVGKRCKLRAMRSPIELPPFEAKLYWHERYHREPSNQWIRHVVAGYFPSPVAPERSAPTK